MRLQRRLPHRRNEIVAARSCASRRYLEDLGNRIKRERQRDSRRNGLVAIEHKRFQGLGAAEPPVAIFRNDALLKGNSRLQLFVFGSPGDAEREAPDRVESPIPVRSEVHDRLE